MSAIDPHVILDFLQAQHATGRQLSSHFDAARSILNISCICDSELPEPWSKNIGITYRCGDVNGVAFFAPVAAGLKRTLSVGIPRSTSALQNPIPRRVFQAWLQAEGEVGSLKVPPEMEVAIQSWRQDGWTHELYNEQMIRDFFRREFPSEYLETYDLLIPKAFKADFWRYAVLYKFGGVYADSKMELLAPLDELIRPTDNCILTVDGDDYIAIAFMAFTAGHPLLEGCLRQIIDLVKRRDRGSHPLALTGPLVAAAAMRQHFNFAGPLPLAAGPDWQTYTFGRPVVGPAKTHFYDREGRPIIKYLYDNYKLRDNQDWKHYPVLWYNNILFRDCVPAEIAAQF